MMKVFFDTRVSMTKYLGAGGRRYESDQLGAWFSADEFLKKWGDDPMVASPAKEMHSYLSRAGSFLDWDAFHQKIQENEYYCGLYVYHYAEATVSVRYRFNTCLAREDVAGSLSV
jgi:hypothetical protein